MDGGRAIAFGLRWASDVPLHQFTPGQEDGQPADVIVRRAEALSRPRQRLVRIDNAELCDDGVRYQAGAEVGFDTWGGQAIDWVPGAAWAGAFPSVFFSTLTALLLAFRGGVPVHGTAVEVDGAAVLICGPSGAGKSTLAAGLIAQGGRLVSDDLSVITSRQEDGAPVLYPGRPGLQLFPPIADQLADAVGAPTLRPGARGKRVLSPPRPPMLSAVPLRTVLVLGEEAGVVASDSRSALLRHQLFRPRWMRSVPGARERVAALHRAAGRIHMEALLQAGDQAAPAFTSRALSALEAIRRGAAPG